jgi:hypothetical protein
MNDGLRHVRNFKLAYLFLYLIPLAVAFVVFTGSPAAGARIAGEDCAPGIKADPLVEGSLERAADETIRRFMHHAVLRQEAVCGYDLASVEVRQGESRESWRDGSIPIVPFVTESPSLADSSVQWVPKDAAQPVGSNLHGEPELRVYVQVTDGVRVGVYELALVWRGDRFQVSYAMPPFTPATAPNGTA